MARNRPHTLMPGMRAPDFRLRSCSGDTVTLHGALNKCPIVLAFYGGQSSIYSYRWLKSLGAVYLNIRAAGAELLALSHDSANKACDTLERYQIIYTLLSDPSLNAIKDYDVLDPVNEAALPAVFVVDKSSRILHIQTGNSPPDLPDTDKIINALKMPAGIER